MDQLLLGLDLGTSGTKGVLINPQGDLAGKEKSNYELNRPNEGWAEQDPEDWWKAVKQVVKSLVDGVDNSSEKISAIALSGQMHGSVFLDSTRGVIRPPILWNDTRTTEQCEKIKQEIGEEKLLKLVGNPVLEGFTAPKVLWLRENEPNSYEKLDKLLLPKDYIVYRLTGEISTEESDAAGTVLFNVKDKKWETQVTDTLGVDSDILPPVINSTEPVGTLRSDVARELGLDDSTIVVAGGADNACSAVGNGITEEGRFLVSIGSSGVVLAHTDSMLIDPGGRLHSFNHAKRNSWYLMGVMLSAGISFDWFREKMGHLEKAVSELVDLPTYELLNQEAASVKPGESKLIFLPYLNGERTPYPDPDARGVFFGLTSSHEKGHIVRSILEGVAFGLRDSLELIKDKGVEPKEIRITGGGARSDIWSQIQADVFGHELKKVSVDEGPAFGAALLAGVGSGIYEDVDQAVNETVNVTTAAEPNKGNTRFYDELYEVYGSLYSSLKSDFRDLSRIEEIS